MTAPQPSRSLGPFELFARADDVTYATRPGIVYGLVGADDPEHVWYVGMTGDPSSRFATHAKSAYAEHIRRHSGVFAMVVLERCADATELLNAERKWITHFNALGMADFNISGTRGTPLNREVQS